MILNKKKALSILNYVISLTLESRSYISLSFHQFKMRKNLDNWLKKLIMI